MSLNDLKTMAIDMVNWLETTLKITGRPCHPEKTQTIINKIESIVSTTEQKEMEKEREIAELKRIIQEKDEEICRLQKEIEKLEEKKVVGPDGKETKEDDPTVFEQVNPATTSSPTPLS
uniref:Uncharacterized protein n=1 Tax=Panagrolaimus sp. JU765 TaxID=591449 RepID=A0AC34R2T6_9BILA